MYLHSTDIVTFDVYSLFSARLFLFLKQPFCYRRSYLHQNCFYF